MTIGTLCSSPRWWRVLFAAALISATWVSLMPMPGPQLFEMQDKVLHVVAYAAFYVLAWLSFPGPVLQWRLHGGLFAYGVAIELLQGLTPSRSMEAMDLLADVTGLGLGCLLLSLSPVPTRWVIRALEIGDSR